MDEVFAWSVTPQSKLQSKRFDTLKRKCEDDSGYSSCPSTLRSQSSTYTPEQRSSCHEDCDNLYTPCLKTGLNCQKPPRVSIKGKCLNYSSATPIEEVDSYSDFLMEASLYTEPMEVAPEAPSLCNISEEHMSIGSLHETEESKDIDFSNLVTSNETPRCTPLPRCPSYSSWATPDTPIYYRSTLDSPRKSRDILTIPKRTPPSRPHCLVGFEKIDILFHIGEKLCHPHIVSQILDELSPSDLASVTMVSKTWKRICLSDHHSKQRWLKHVSKRKDNRENLFSSGGKTKSAGPPLTTRNHSTPLHIRQPTSPPVSPSKMRFHLFQKEARKLKEDETLMKCPRCSLPSKCSPSLNQGLCTGLSCQLKFCTICRSEYHSPRQCSLYKSSNSLKKRHTIGSKESKRFLRRL